jgi:hypothetical protein
MCGLSSTGRLGRQKASALNNYALFKLTVTERMYVGCDHEERPRVPMNVIELRRVRES